MNCCDLIRSNLIWCECCVSAIIYSFIRRSFIWWLWFVLCIFTLYGQPTIQSNSIQFNSIQIHSTPIQSNAIKAISLYSTPFHFTERFTPLFSYCTPLIIIVYKMKIININLSVYTFMGHTIMLIIWSFDHLIIWCDPSSIPFSQSVQSIQFIQSVQSVPSIDDASWHVVMRACRSGWVPYKFLYKYRWSWR